MVPHERFDYCYTIDEHPMGTLLAAKTCVATDALIRLQLRNNGIIARLVEERNALAHDPFNDDDEIASRGFADP